MKISFLLSLIIIVRIPFTRASWFADASQIIGDATEHTIRFFGFDLSTEKGLHNCGDKIIYTQSEKNKWNFHGIDSHYPCCEGYKRSNEKDVDCLQAICSGISDCDDRGKCVKPGECDCNFGYSGAYTGCSAICSGLEDCGDRGQCVKPGKCQCYRGYTGTRAGCKFFTCSGTHDCENRGDCISPNLCTCHAGFTGSKEGCRKVTDINECEEGTHTCDHTCVDTKPGYKCLCREGYQLGDDRKSCFNINECEDGTHACKHNCKDSAPGYECSCREGYELKEDGKSCHQYPDEPMLVKRNVDVPERELQAKTPMFEYWKIGMIVGGTALAVVILATVLCLCFSSHKKNYKVLSEA